MIIDVHGHYTTAPGELRAWRNRQKDANAPISDVLEIADDQIRESIEQGQLKFIKERGADVTLFSPTAGGMEHHVGGPEVSLQWTRTVNDLIHRVCTLFPNNFIGVCQLPQSPGISPKNCVEELERCVNEYGFVGCNINPDPTDGYWTDPPMTDSWWHPLYEKMVELQVPGMIHVSGSCNPNFHGTGAHYINGDTSTFMQFILADLFKTFPDLKFVIPHGGGAVPYHWGRYRGIAQDANRPPIETLLNNVWFDTCVYGYKGIETLVSEVGASNVIFASEMIGAVKSIDPRSGHYFDDTKRYIDALNLSSEDQKTIFEGNARRVYPRLAAKLAKKQAVV
jgi:4-oxalmesaconate hydratase